MKYLMAIPLLLMSLVVNAGLINFDEGATTQTGTLTYDGNGGAAVGTDIIFTTIDGVATPLNSGSVLECRGCELDFLTGLNTLEGPALWQWMAGGSFTVTGEAYDGATLIASGTLLAGTFGGTPSVVGNAASALFVSLGVDEKHDDLEAFYGYDPDQPWVFAHTNLALDSCVAAGGAGGFACDVNNADLANASRVPTPATAMLFGIGAAGLVASRRRFSGA